MIPEPNIRDLLDAARNLLRELPEWVTEREVRYEAPHSVLVTLGDDTRRASRLIPVELFLELARPQVSAIAADLHQARLLSADRYAHNHDITLCRGAEWDTPPSGPLKVCVRGSDGVDRMVERPGLSEEDCRVDVDQVVRRIRRATGLPPGDIRATLSQPAFRAAQVNLSANDKLMLCEPPSPNLLADLWGIGGVVVDERIASDVCILEAAPPDGEEPGPEHRGIIRNCSGHEPELL